MRAARDACIAAAGNAVRAVRGLLRGRGEAGARTGAVDEIHGALRVFHEPVTGRAEYIALVREAMRRLVDAVVGRDGEVVADTGTVYHARTRTAEVRWVDGGTGRYWNLYVHAHGRSRWSACVIDACAPGDGIRFEICYESPFIRTEDIARVVRTHPGGEGVRIYTGKEDVGQQSGLTLPMVRDVLAAALA